MIGLERMRALSWRECERAGAGRASRRELGRTPHALHDQQSYRRSGLLCMCAERVARSTYRDALK